MTCQSSGPCKDHAHADFFVHNLLNLAAQYDASWTGWGWRGRNSPSGNCTRGQTQCNTPDMRDNGPDGWTGVLTDGTRGGANWTRAWAAFVAPPGGGAVAVADALPGVHLNASAYEPEGYLPRPCIVGQFNIGGFCGWPLGTNASTVARGWNSLWNQTVFESVLPGLPPSAASPAAAAAAAAGTPLCVLQTCPGFDPCNTTSPIIPMPDPCGA